jgi:hypothetical protein
MRKRVVAPISQQAPAWDEGWLNLENLVSVEVTSEYAEWLRFYVSKAPKLHAALLWNE